MNSKNKNIELNKESIRICAFLFILLVSIVQISCKKLVEVPPPNGTITEDFVYTTDATAIAVLTDLYAKMNYTPFQGGGGNISLFAGLAADEYELNNGITDASYIGYYNNLLNANPPTTSGCEHWSTLYNSIFKCNAAIEGLNNSTKLTQAVKQQLLGEAKFLRGFLYFYLVNMFGDVPLALTTDPAVNSKLSRTPKDHVYEQIKTDLKEAADLLSASFLNNSLLKTTAERVRPTRWAANALLARVYLYLGDWTNAEIQSNLVINNSLFSLLGSLNDVFLKNSREAIWQIQPVDESYNTQEATILVIPPGGPTPGSISNPIQLSTQLLNSFEIGDRRKEIKNWIDSVEVSGTAYYFPFKYKQSWPDNNISGASAINYMTEYFMVLRLAEQYLIRAEARAQLGNIGGAQSDLNAIRNRAGLSNTIANVQSSLLTAILEERRHELFSEWGHRWFDLKRTGKIDQVMTIVTPQKTGGTNTWKSYQQLYPLPLTDLQRDPNLQQNPGYN